MYSVDVKLHIYTICLSIPTLVLSQIPLGFGEVNITDKSDNRDINYCMTPKHQTIQIVLFKSKTNT